MIRYDKKLNNEINQVIRNFNQKVRRLEKSERDLILPNTITKKELKENVYTRAELRRKLNSLKRFSDRNVERTITTKMGVKLSQYELNEIKRESARVKTNITRQLTQLKIKKPTVFGKEQATTFAQMGSTDYLNLLSRRQALEKDLTKLNKEELQRYQNLLSKASKNQQYMNNIFKDNYLKILTDLGYFYGYDDNKLDKLKKKLYNLNPNDFLELFKTEQSIKAILDYYPVITNSFNFINPNDIKDDVKSLYDNLINNIDEIIK